MHTDMTCNKQSPIFAEIIIKYFDIYEIKTVEIFLKWSLVCVNNINYGNYAIVCSAVESEHNSKALQILKFMIISNILLACTVLKGQNVV